MSIYLTDRPCPACGAPLISDGRRVDWCSRIGVAPGCTHGTRQDAPAPIGRPVADQTSTPRRRV